MPSRHRVAICASHPIQYLAPWFAQLAQDPRIDLTVLYGSLDGQTRAATDRDFGQAVRWDVDLLSGYRFVELPSHSLRPGLDRFFGVASLALFRLLRRERFDAVVILGWNYALYPLALLAALSSGTPVILRGDSVRYVDADEVEADSEGLARARLWLKTWTLRRYIGQCAATLAVSSGNARLLRHYGVPDDKIFFAPYAVDSERFRLTDSKYCESRRKVRAELGISDEVPLLLFCGKLSAVKAPSLLLSAYARLRASGLRASLAFCGDGALRAALEARVEREAISDVHFLGFRNQAELPSLYAAADALVIPSVREAFAMVVPEAMLAGLPVVASERVGCVEDLVRDGETGLCFPSGNEDRLLACLTMLCDPQRGLALRRKLGDAARERMKSWTYVQTTEGLLAALEAIDRRCYGAVRAQRKPWLG
jgi:glycosyltransferase involved in cell wall biosynthesis